MGLALAAIVWSTNLGRIRVSWMGRPESTLWPILFHPIAFTANECFKCSASIDSTFCLNTFSDIFTS